MNKTPILNSIIKPEISTNLANKIKQPEDITPTFIFREIITNKLLQKICNWTNDYHNQLNNKETDNKNLGNKNIRKHQIKWKDLTLDEVYDFILLQIYFGVVKIPDIRLCWSKNAYLNQKYVYEKKSRDRYRQISQYIRYSVYLDNSDNKESKYKDFLFNSLN